MCVCVCVCVYIYIYMHFFSCEQSYLLGKEVMRLSERDTGKVKGQTEVLMGGSEAQREQVRLDDLSRPQTYLF